MKWQETLITPEQLEKVIMLDKNTIAPDAYELALKAQAEISFKAGEEVGRWKVVAYIEDEFGGAYEGLTEHLHGIYEPINPNSGNGG